MARKKGASNDPSSQADRTPVHQLLALGPRGDSCRQSHPNGYCRHSAAPLGPEAGGWGGEHLSPPQLAARPKRALRWPANHPTNLSFTKIQPFPSSDVRGRVLIVAASLTRNPRGGRQARNVGLGAAELEISYARRDCVVRRLFFELLWCAIASMDRKGSAIGKDPPAPYVIPSRSCAAAWTLD
jgi:hypothetical protein